MLGRAGGGTIVGDKTPDYGLCMRLIDAIWPEAKFIHVVRDGRDVALSMSQVLRFRILAASGEYRWWPLGWKRNYERWLDRARADIPLGRFFEVWLRRLTGMRDEAMHLRSSSVLDISYAEILRGAAETLQRAGAFLSLPDDAGWIARASARVLPANLNRNRDRPEYAEMTRRFGDALAAAGFSSAD